MKECAYCGGTVSDDVTTCPHCSGIEFKNKCPICGQAIEGTFCPDCAARQAKEEAEARAKAQEDLAEQATIDEANSGLVWKTVLTVFLPFVGGYFLIKEHVRTGFRAFAIIWCAFLAISVASAEGGSAGGNVLAVLMCLAPIGLYLFKSRKRLLGIGASDDGSRGSGTSSNGARGSSASSGGILGKLLYVGFAALLGYTLIGAIASAQAPSDSEAVTASASSAQTATSA